MWTLENEGNAMHGKKQWLRPGKKFLIGRTRPADYIDDGWFVNDKTISRKHLTIEVEPLPLEACRNPRKTSRLILTDLSTKIGTLVNGEQIKGKSVVLEKEDNEVTIGKYAEHFRFKWVPVTVSFTFTNKELKQQPFDALYEQLGPLDIKVLEDYQRGVTTHVAAKKRNTQRNLQALIDGRYIVHHEKYIDAIIKAAQPGDAGASPLELDFEANWPDEGQFLPPKGEEPTSRGDEAYAPDRYRQDMFDGYTFVFYEQKQFETLLAPVTNGRGKAVYREVVPDVTTVDDFVRYVKEIAGEKGLGEFEDGSEGKGVVVVRYNLVKGFGSEFFAKFGRDVALRLDHRLIEQNEFLDAILGCDASVLRRPLEFEMSGIVAPPPTAATVKPTQVAKSFQAPPVSTPVMEEPPVPETSRRGRSRRNPRTAFKGFDDDDFSGPAVMHSIPESMQVDSVPAPSLEESQQSQGLFVTQDPNMVVHREISLPPETQNRKRRATTPLEDEDELMEEMAPATTALKRRRLADEIERKRRGIPSPSPRREPSPPLVKKETTPKKSVAAKPAPKTARGRKTKEVSLDLLDDARKRREEEEAAKIAEQEAIEAKFEGIAISDIKADVKIEIMEIRRSAPPRRAAHADESERWEDKWNGRKNFKRFRRRGGEEGGQRGFGRVIVPLEEAKKKDYGIGDDYWDADGASQRRRRKEKGKGRDGDEQESRPQSRARADEAGERNGYESPPTPPIVKSRSRPQSQVQAQAQTKPKPKAKAALPTNMPHLSDDSDVEIVERPPPATSSTSTTPSLADKTRNASIGPVASPRKRVAESALSKPAPAKKARQTTLMSRARQESDDDSDDGLKFKFKKRR